MTEQQNPQDETNNRVFPRIDAQCPLMHRENDQQRWSVGVLINFSATGVFFNSTRALEIGSPIAVRLERGRNRTIPALSGSGNVIRCDELDSGKYEIACKLDRIDPPSSNDA